MSFGASLKRERELRGITLDEIARETKISVQMLACIDSDRFDQLPQGVFGRSFVRSYASYLGIDEGKAVQEYLLATESIRSAESSLGLSGGQRMFASLPPEKGIPRNSFRQKILVGIAFLLAFLGVFCFVEFQNWMDQEDLNVPQELRSIQLAGPQQNAAVRSNPLGPSNLSDKVTMAANQHGLVSVLSELTPQETNPSTVLSKLVLRIKARASVWVAVSVNNTTLFSGLLRSQEMQSFSLQRPLKVSLLNPKRVEISVNNQLFEKLDDSGELKTIVVSAENYLQFLKVVE